MTRYFDIAPAPSRADTPAGASRRRRRNDAGVIDMRREDSFPAWPSSVTLGASARHEVLFHARSSHFHSTLTTRSRSDVARSRRHWAISARTPNVLAPDRSHGCRDRERVLATLCCEDAGALWRTRAH